jgi:uncharacterized protein
MRRTWLVLLILAATAPAPEAQTAAPAEDACSFDSGDSAESLAKALANAKSCAAAAAKFNDCRWGSSADTQFAPIVIGKCEQTFFRKLSSAGKTRYATEMQLCAYEYSRQTGTLYMSEAASCQVDVASAYAAKPALANSVEPRASFDCGKAKTPLEMAICSDIRLGHADIVLSRAYAPALTNPDTKRTELVQNQKHWLEAVPAKCGLTGAPAPKKTIDCIIHEFEVRFTDLDRCDLGGDMMECLNTPDEPEEPEGKPGLDTSQRASFNCEKPATGIEIAICADSSLGKADIQLAESYIDAGSNLGPGMHAPLVMSERHWLRFVNQSCPLGAIGGIPPLLTRECLREAFEVRSEQLQTCPRKPVAEQLSCLNHFMLMPESAVPH